MHRWFANIAGYAPMHSRDIDDSDQEECGKITVITEAVIESPPKSNEERKKIALPVSRDGVKKIPVKERGLNVITAQQGADAVDEVAVLSRTAPSCNPVIFPYRNAEKRRKCYQKIDWLPMFVAITLFFVALSLLVIMLLVKPNPDKQYQQAIYKYKTGKLALAASKAMPLTNTMTQHQKARYPLASAAEDENNVAYLPTK